MPRRVGSLCRRRSRGIYVNPNLPHNANQKLSLALHELGHQLGFADVYGCNWGTVMGQGMNAPYWFTDYDYCGMNTYYDPFCEAGGGVDYDNHCTPLVLSFRGLPRLSAPEVPFDIAATGDYPLCGWLDRPVDGLLVLDRDGDGLINNGKELFGNSTPFASGTDGPRSWSGFNALEFFDRAVNGGNGNRVIDSGDSVFGSLRVWFDRNRDGISQAAELITLQRLGIEHLRLDGQSMNRVDRHGNVLWFGTTFEYRVGGTTATGRIVDVIFKVR